MRASFEATSRVYGGLCDALRSNRSVIMILTIHWNAYLLGVRGARSYANQYLLNWSISPFAASRTRMIIA